MNDAHTPPLLLVLIEEYKIHKDDLHRHRAIYTNNTTYLQFLGVFLFTLYIYTFEQQKVVQNLPFELKASILTLGSLLIFFFFSSVIASIYMFFILRRRMADIEKRVNMALGEEAMLYESRIAPIYFERPSPYHGVINPLSYSSIFRLLLFLIAIFSLFYMAPILLDTNIAAVYILTNIYITITLIVVYARIYYLARDGFHDLHSPKVGLLGTSWSIMCWFLNLFVILLFVWISYGEAGQRITIWAINLIKAIQYTHDYAIFAAIGLYTFFCAIVVPTPSELPILFANTLPILPLLAASSVGRAIGAIVLGSAVLLWRRILPNWLVRTSFDVSPRGSYWRDGMAPALYILFQSIPFLPMRTSTIFYAIAGGPRARTLLWIGLANLVGTPVRMLLMLTLITLGVYALEPILSD